MRQNSPCKDCSARALHCHSTCSRYAAYRQDIDAENAKAAAERAENNFRYEVKKAIIYDTLRKAGAIKYGKIT